MLKVTAQQLTDNPDMPEEIMFNTDTFSNMLFVNDICDGVPKYRNVSSAQPDDGHKVLSFKWNGEYEGVVVYQIFIESL